MGFVCYNPFTRRFMGHNKIVKDNIIRYGTGAIEHIVAEEDAQPRSFAVVARCGHVGNGYFIPICFAVMAKDLESAIKLVKERSRVQRDHKDCILAACEISAPEYCLINYHNDRDSYLKTNYVDEDFGYVERRRIVAPETLKEVLSGKSTYVHKLRGVELQLPLLEEIKTEDKYETYQTLQRAFAPRLYGDRYVYPTHTNVRDLLDKYYGEIAVLQGILRNKSHPLILYYQIFGEGNELGLTYSYGEMKYTSLNGNKVYVPVTEEERTYIENSEFVRAKKVKPETNFDEIEYKPTTSARDKFNRRMQRYQEINAKKTEPQRGE